MLYQKYRPQTLDQIDNSNVKEKIVNFLNAKTVPHSWIFTGGRGMGKTSIARILAYEVNKTQDAKFNQILAQDIASNSNPDIQEINGADTTGIDAIRELIEKAQFAPLTCKYRVYIIDEVHMLSTSAFNGLLKILEEPPAHAIFILATTDFHKIPQTIASRCVRVDFGLAKAADIELMLARIEAGENVKISKDVKELIVNKSDKSFRDATKLAEELIAQNALSATDATAYLQNMQSHELLPILCNKKTPQAIAFLDSYTKQGGDIKYLIEDTIAKLHALMLKANNITPEINTPDEATFSITQLSKLLKLFSDAYILSKNSPLPAVAVQIAIIEYYQFTNSK